MRSDDNKGGHQHPLAQPGNWCGIRGGVFSATKVLKPTARGFLESKLFICTSSLRAVLSYAFGTRLCLTRAYAGSDLWKQLNIFHHRRSTFSVHIPLHKPLRTWTLVTWRGLVSWPWWWLGPSPPFCWICPPISSTCGTSWIFLCLNSSEQTMVSHHARKLSKQI